MDFNGVNCGLKLRGQILLIIGALTCVFSNPSPDQPPAFCIPCKNDSHCLTYAPNAICLGNACYDRDANNRLNQRCIEIPNKYDLTKKCDSSTNSTVCGNDARCIGGKCVCDMGFYFSSKTDNCQKYKLSDLCLFSADCSLALGAGAFCSDGKCTCKEPTHLPFNDEGCFAPIKINYECSRNEECLLVTNNSMCGEAGFCRCQPTYMVVNLRCEAIEHYTYVVHDRGSGSNLTSFWVWISIATVAIIFLLFAVKWFCGGQVIPVWAHDLESANQNQPDARINNGPRDTANLISPQRGEDKPPAYDQLPISPPAYEDAIVIKMIPAEYKQATAPS